MHCKYLPVVPYKALENFSEALYGTTGGTYSACIIRPVMFLLWIRNCRPITGTAVCLVDWDAQLMRGVTVGMGITAMAK